MLTEGLEEKNKEEISSLGTTEILLESVEGA
jgi:hypothetical protein